MANSLALLRTVWHIASSDYNLLIYKLQFQDTLDGESDMGIGDDGDSDEDEDDMGLTGKQTHKKGRRPPEDEDSDNDF